MIKPSHILLTVFIAFSFAATSQITSYFENEPTWRVQTAYQYGSTCIKYSQEEHYFSGDTTMANGETYQILSGKRSFYFDDYQGNDPNCTDYGFEYFYVTSLRQEGSMIYQWVENYEVLLYHFDLEIGDTLQGALMYDDTQIIVTGIEFIETPVGELRRFLIEGGYSEYLIEGIGHYNGLLFPLAATVNWSSELICYKQGGNIIVETGSECSIVSSIEDIINDVSVTISPNPFLDEIRLAWDSNIASFTDVALYDSMGRVIHQEFISHNEVNGTYSITGLEALSSGLYFIELKQEDNRRVLKLIK